MSTSINRRSFATLLVALALSIALIPLSGCGSSFVIGTKSSDATRIAMKNEIGQAIIEVAVVAPGAQDASEPLEQEAAWDVDVTAEVYLDLASIQDAAASGTEDVSADGEEASDVVVEPLASLQLTTIDGMTYTLHQLNLADVKDATVKFEDGTAYLVYTSIATGEEVSTLGAELAYQEQVKAAEEAARLQAEQERAAQEQRERQKQQNTAPKSSSPMQGSQAPSAPSTDSNAASSGEDACVDDLVLN